MTALLCSEYCVVEFGARDVGVPLVSWNVTPSNSGLLSDIRVMPNARRNIYAIRFKPSTRVLTLFTSFVCSASSYCSVKENH